MSTDEQNRSLLTAWLGAWNTHDAEQLASFLCPDAVYEDVVMGVVTHCRQDATEFFTATLEAFPDLEMELDTAIATESGGAIEWRFSGTQQTDVPGYPGVGTRVSARGGTTVVFHDGQFARIRDYCELSAGSGLANSLEGAWQAAAAKGGSQS